MIVLGVDAGARGGAALIYPNGFLEMQEWRSLNTFISFCDQFKYDPVIAYVEKVAARPGQGVSSMFKFGMNYGSILGALSALQIKTELVTPQAWMKEMHRGASGATTKDKSVDAALRLFPKETFILPKCRKPHLGIVEAALIALYGVKQVRKEV